MNSKRISGLTGWQMELEGRRSAGPRNQKSLSGVDARHDECRHHRERDSRLGYAPQLQSTSPAGQHCPYRWSWRVHRQRARSPTYPASGRKVVCGDRDEYSLYRRQLGLMG
jgi:hypothetical protein